MAQMYFNPLDSDVNKDSITKYAIQRITKDYNGKISYNNYLDYYDDLDDRLDNRIQSIINRLKS